MASILLWLLAVPVLALTAGFTAEVLLGLKRSVPSPTGRNSDELLRAVIIVPAHDEADHIGHTVAMLGHALPPGSRLLVVADNCSDATAEVARAAGADVVVRNEAGRRGKGFALAFARDQLAAAPPDVVAIIDADCRMDAASLQALLSQAADGPAQAINLLEPEPDASAMVQVSSFAFLIKNLVRQRGMSRLSGRVHLTGTGMALPWRLFATAPLATDDLVEDLSLGLDLAAQGFRAILVPDATVWSAASTRSGTLEQRKRWEGGFLATSRRRGLPLLMTALRRASFPDLWAAFNLLIPPLALLIMVDVVVLATGMLLVLAGASILPVLLLACAMIAAGAAVFLAWHLLGRAHLTPRAALRLPFYLLWKLPLYVGLARGKPQTWTRTIRR